MNQLNPIRPEEPAFGCVLLAQTDAAEIAHELLIAELCIKASPRDMDQYADRVRTAQLRLGTLARRLGYDLVPASATETVDA